MVEIEPGLQPQALPALRTAIDLTPLGAGGERLFLLRDRADPEAAPLVVSQAALLLASLLDGERSLGAVRAAFELRTGVRIAAAELRAFVERLDEANLLDSPRYREYRERQRREYLAAPELVVRLPDDIRIVE